MTKDRIELLAPAGSFDSLVAAVNAGADAVYMGGPRFGARAYADNPEEEGLIRALDFVHLRGKRLFLTVNTLLKEDELREDLADYLAPFAEAGLDAVIVQDLGVLRFLCRHFPDLPVHISTQGTICGKEAAALLREAGVKRLILPRELSLPEIREISAVPGLETEVFVHGSLCYCYSGQCLMSSFLGGRSGNRGRCAQPCRKPFEGGRLLNMRDLCALDFLPELAAAGVRSLKIEGRMKDWHYTEGVVSVYRKYLDLLEEKGPQAFRVEAEDRKLLSALFDRGGFTDGYFRRHNGADMVVLERPDVFKTAGEEVTERLDRLYGREIRPLPVKAEAEIRAGKPAFLKLTAPSGESAAVTGAEAQPARERPLSKEEIARQLAKTGGSDFEITEMEIRTDEGSFLPVSALNALRREALAALRERMLAPHRRPVTVPAEEAEEKSLLRPGAALLTVSLEDPAVLPAVLAEKAVREVSLSTEFLTPEEWREKARLVRESGRLVRLVLPCIVRKEAREELEGWLPVWQECPPDSFLVRSLDGLAFLTRRGVPGKKILDAGAYVWNREAAAAWKALGADGFTYPPEPHRDDLAALESLPLERELTVYGRLPMMVSAQCIRRTRGACLKKGGAAPAVSAPVTIRDHTGAVMPVRTVCRYCYNLIYNAVPLWLADLALPAADRLRISLTVETPQEAARILRKIAGGLSGKGEDAAPPEGFAFTRGHWNKGVQ